MSSRQGTAHDRGSDEQAVWDETSKAMRMAPRRPLKPRRVLRFGLRMMVMSITPRTEDRYGNSSTNNLSAAGKTEQEFVQGSDWVKIAE